MAPPSAPGGGSHTLSRGFSASGLLDLPGLLAAALPVVFQYEGDPVAFVERADARHLQRARVDENVLRAILRGDEAETLRAVEKLDRA